MEDRPREPLQSSVLAQLAESLNDVRDSWVMISLVLTDLVADAPSSERDELMTEIERYLGSIRDSDRKHIE